MREPIKVGTMVVYKNEYGKIDDVVCAIRVDSNGRALIDTMGGYVLRFEEIMDWMEE